MRLRFRQVTHGLGILALSAITFALMPFNVGLPDRTTDEMVLVSGTSLTTNIPNTEMKNEVEVRSFLIDKNLVTVAEFDSFVKSTGYITDAERFGNSGVFLLHRRQWVMVDGADYRYPYGREEEPAKPDHPVTQVSWNDAMAYANWKGKRLPTQWEWELAAKNGADTDQEYTWGERLKVNGKFKANTWQGSFPYYNTQEDGYLTTSPVGVFGENELGLNDMGGNVWQWCSDDIPPTSVEASTDPANRKVLRGGSFLCDTNVCRGYRVAGRSSSTPESSMVHIGFRCAKDSG